MDGGAAARARQLLEEVHHDGQYATALLRHGASGGASGASGVITV